MLESTKISRRQSEIRSQLSELVGKDAPSESEVRSMTSLDEEYRTNETRFRAALIAEDQERSEAGREIENRSQDQWAALVENFELRQVALNLDEGRALTGQTNEVVTELRSKGGYRGIPIPWAALETRAGETVSTGTPNPITTRPIIERLFSGSMAARMGGQIINVPVGETEFPVTTSKVAAGWASGETGEVAAPQAYTTLDRPLKPNHNLGVQMRITRKTLLQAGTGLEQAIRRDMNGAIGEALDKAVFLGSGAGGEPTGIFAGAQGWGITITPVDAAATYANFRSAAVRFMNGNAASDLADIRLMLRPEIFDNLDDQLITGTAVSEWDRLIAKIGQVNLTSNALEAPDSTGNTNALLSVSSGGVAPFFVGAWGAIDLIRDPYSDANSGQLRLTALTTADVTISRAVQLEVLTGLQ